MPPVEAKRSKLFCDGTISLRFHIYHVNNLVYVISEHQVAFTILHTLRKLFAMFECNRESSKLHYRQMYCCESIIPVGDRAMRYKQLANLNNLRKIYDLSDLRYIVRA